jgi:hypothetical protein
MLLTDLHLETCKIGSKKYKLTKLQLKQYATKMPVLIIVANKNDQPNRVVSTEDAYELAEKLNAK